MCILQTLIRAKELPGENELFNKQLQNANAMDNLGSRAFIIVAGDLNAQVGKKKLTEETFQQERGMKIWGCIS